MIADERLVRAFLHVIRHVALFVRSRSTGRNRLSDEHLFDLMDAIHNVPSAIRDPQGYFTVEKLRDGYFAPYDERWGDEGIQLVRLLDRGMQCEDEGK